MAQQDFMFDLSGDKLYRDIQGSDKLQNYFLRELGEEQRGKPRLERISSFKKVALENKENINPQTQDVKMSGNFSQLQAKYIDRLTNVGGSNSVSNRGSGTRTPSFRGPYQISPAIIKEESKESDYSYSMTPATGKQEQEQDVTLRSLQRGDTPTCSVNVFSYFKVKSASISNQEVQRVPVSTSSANSLQFRFPDLSGLGTSSIRELAPSSSSGAKNIKVQSGPSGKLSKVRPSDLISMIKISPFAVNTQPHSNGLAARGKEIEAEIRLIKESLGRGLPCRSITEPEESPERLSRQTIRSKLARAQDPTEYGFHKRSRHQDCERRRSIERSLGSIRESLDNIRSGIDGYGEKPSMQHRVSDETYLKVRSTGPLCPKSATNGMLETARDIQSLNKHPPASLTLSQDNYKSLTHENRRTKRHTSDSGTLDSANRALNFMSTQLTIEVRDYSSK